MLHTHEGSRYRAQISIKTIYAHIKVSTRGLAQKSDLCRSLHWIMRLHTEYRHNVAVASTTLMSRQMKALSHRF